MNEASALAAIATYSPVVVPAGFVLLALCEAMAPARPATTSLTLRWFGNAGVFVLGWVASALFPFLSATAASLFAREHGLGLFNMLQLSPAIALCAGLLALDLIAYWEHRLLHAFRPFWRLHALHHSDTDVDVATYVRHHPFEAILQAILDAGATIALGLPPLAIALYAVSASVVQMAAHANVDAPWIGRWLGAVLVTPEFHRMHHSRRYEENNSNFSQALSIWDRMFGTASLPRSCDLLLGLPEFIDTRFQRIDRMLLLPVLIPGAAPAIPEQKQA